MIPFLALAASAALQSTTPAERPWTFLVYGAADNNADGPILHFLDRVRGALDDDPGVELVLFIDRSEGFSDDATLLGEDFTGGRVYRLRKSSAERIDPGDAIPEIAGDGDREVDSADPALLGRFVEFGKRRFPARHYGLLIYSHADGRGMCPDEESEREMWIPELPMEVGAEASVDFLGLELCNMSGVEIAYEWRPGNGGFAADVLVAIPNAGPPLDWDRAFARIRSKGHASEAPEPHLDPATMGAAELGCLVIEEGRRGRVAMAEGHPGAEEAVRFESAACCDLTAVASVKKALDSLAVALARSGGREVFEALRGPSERGKTLDFVRSELEHSPYFDLYDLCRRAAGCDELGQDVRDSAKTAADAVDRMVLASFGMDGLEGFEAGKSGVFLVFPDGGATDKVAFGNSKRTRWANFRWYSPLESQAKGDPYGRWSFLADGATPGNGVVENWFELLESWYDPDPEGNGGVDGYRW